MLFFLYIPFEAVKFLKITSYSLFIDKEVDADGTLKRKKIKWRISH